MRLFVEFSKNDALKYISHLDLQRLFQRALRRAHIPVAFSQGFNPHPRISFASALPVGMCGENEIMDIALSTGMDPGAFVSAVNSVLPNGISVNQAYEADEKLSSPMGILALAEYEVFIERGYTAVAQAIDEMLSREEIIAVKKTKNGKRKINIRPMIIKCSAGAESLSLMLLTGSSANLSPELLLTEAFMSAGLEYDPACVAITRIKLLAKYNNSYISYKEYAEKANLCGDTAKHTQD